MVRGLIVITVALCSCTDAADVPTTIVRASLSATCMSPDCTGMELYPSLYGGHCGYTAPQLEEDDREAVLAVDMEAEDIDGFVQLQYRLEPFFVDQQDNVLTRDVAVDVHPAYESDPGPLYRISATGEVTDIDMSRLASTDGNTLELAYPVQTYQGATFAATETHVIDSRSVRIETEDPSVCYCSSGRAVELAPILLAFAGLVRRRRVQPRSRSGGLLQ